MLNLSVASIEGTFAGGDGSRQPSQLELKLAEHQGSHLTQIATALKIAIC